ncbi:Uncharacterised protein [Klebsiella pneumoniae]|nr:Uncharacterised protein [Klebsiella pneumoniae]
MRLPFHCWQAIVPEIEVTRKLLQMGYLTFDHHMSSPVYNMSINDYINI